MLTTSAKVRAICFPRWEGWTPKKPDPCDHCQLLEPCVKRAPVGVPGLEAYTKWIEGINLAAEEI